MIKLKLMYQVSQDIKCRENLRKFRIMHRPKEEQHNALSSKNDSLEGNTQFFNNHSSQIPFNLSRIALALHRTKILRPKIGGRLSLEDLARTLNPGAEDDYDSARSGKSSKERKRGISLVKAYQFYSLFGDVTKKVYPQEPINHQSYTSKGQYDCCNWLPLAYNLGIFEANGWIMAPSEKEGIEVGDRVRIFCEGDFAFPDPLEKNLSITEGYYYKKIKGKKSLEEFIKIAEKRISDIKIKYPWASKAVLTGKEPDNYYFIPSESKYMDQF